MYCNKLIVIFLNLFPVFGGCEQICLEFSHRTNPGSLAAARELRQRKDRKKRQFFPIRQILGGLLQRVRDLSKVEIGLN